MFHRIVLLSTLIGLAASNAEAADSFKYCAKSETNNYCELTGNWPTNVDETKVFVGAFPGDVIFRGHFSFGMPSKPLLVAMVKEKSSGNLSLYVDTDSNDQLTSTDLAKPIDARSWTAEVTVSSGASNKQEVGAQATNVNRHVLAFRTIGDRVEIANAGRMEGTVALGDSLLEASIEDRNCNGIWTDSEDRLQIDLNKDKSFSPLRERFSCQGSLTIQSKRYGLAFTEDGLAPSLSLKPIEGTGSIVAEISLQNEAAIIESCQAVLASTDGVHLTLSSLNEPIEVPVGEYHVKSLRIAMKDDRKWSTLFEQETTLKPTAVKVEQGASVNFDLLGKLTLSAEITAGNLETPQKGQVVIVPMLTSETGLYLSRCLVGKTVAQSDNTLTASVIQLGVTEKKVSAIESTGFACGSFCPIVFSGKDFGIGKALIMLKFDSGPLAGVMSETAGKIKSK